MEESLQNLNQTLLKAGAALPAVNAFLKAFKDLKLSPKPARATLASDNRKSGRVYQAGEKLLSALPPKGKRNPAQNEAEEAMRKVLRSVRNAFARAYGEILYRRITNHYKNFVRVDELVYQAAEICPGLCPTRKEMESESLRPLAQKEGLEIAQGDFLSRIFSLKIPGLHLIHSMMRPLPQSLELLREFRKKGEVDLGMARLERRGGMGCLFFKNLRHLNAEDNSTVGPLETAVDLALLDPEIKVGLLRGNPMAHPKYQGRRVFSAGLNLTHLYYGRIPFLFFITRDMGFANKIHRGLTGEGFDPEGPESTQEKPWVAAVEAFAIGGGCQLLLVVDYVIAEENAYFNLPAQKEGIVPGVSPLRFSRFVGERIAQEGILFDKTFSVSAPEARFLINEVVPADKIDESIERAAGKVLGGGLVSVGANRKAIRVGQEPRDLLRQFMALHCRDQVDCQYSPGLISNLEQNWDAQRRKI